MARLLASLLLVAYGVGIVQAGSQPVDCLPDRVIAFNPISVNPSSLFGAAFVPGIVLGPPGDSEAFAGSFSVAALGFGGSTTLGFDDIVIEDRPGPDFIVFENPFFRQPMPESAEDDFRIFAEPGIVEVSEDGVQWTAFPFDPEALSAMADLPTSGDIDRALYLALAGLAGITPSFTGNWTVPDDPTVFDPQGRGGVSGAGGDAFDLATVGLSEARFVRIRDADTEVGFPGAGEGFDLDALVVLHGRLARTANPDSDGDGLSDAEEEKLYGSNPALPDSDGDGVDDGREVAGCRNPADPGAEPFLVREPRLWVLGAECTELRWTFMGSGLVYDLIRGDVASLHESAGFVDLGGAVCLPDGDDRTDLRWACDPETPAGGETFFYLVRLGASAHYGRSSRLEGREAAGGCP